MKAEIVSVGTELLLGMINDTNAQFLSQQLADIGIDVYWISQVGDNLGRVVEVLDRASTRSDAVIITGGLGPTEDDLTREAIAAMMGETMAVDPELEQQLRDLFARRNRPMPERNIKQATLIPSATALTNPIGTAPGWWVERNGHVLACMPGVPAEMRLMWESHVRPRLKERAGAGVLVTSTVRILGVGEGGVEEQLGELIHQTNPTVATYAKPDGVQVRISAKAVDEEIARGLIGPTLSKVKDIFGFNVFGGDDQTLCAMVAEHLQRWKWTLTCAERGTVGALSAEIAGDPEMGPYFKGGFLLGTGTPFAVEGMNAIEVAMAARLQLNAEVGVAVLVDAESMTADLGVSVDELTGSGVTNWNRSLPDLRRRASIEALALLLRVVREADEAP